MQFASLIDELRKRRVFRALLGYGVAAFAVLQIIEPIMHGLHWSDEVLTWVVVLLAAGFPIVVALAWIFDVNTAGIERTAPSQSLRGARLVLLLAALGVAAALPGLAWHFLRKAPRAEAEAAAPSIAVLPFATLSPDREQEYLGDGIAEEITGKLSHLKGVMVAARTSVMRFKGAAQSPSEIGAALGVAWLLEGTVRRAGDRIRVTTTLLKSQDGFRVWSEDVDSKLDDIFAVQQRIASRTVDALALKLTPDERRSLSDWGTRNAAAYDQYLQGQILYENFQNREQFDLALGHFGQALKIDPDFAPALAGLSSVEAQYYRDYDSDPARLARADDLARRALAIDPHITRALIAEAEIRMARYDYPGATEYFARVTTEEPQNAMAWDLLCWSEGYETPPRAAEAEQHCRRSLQLNAERINTHYHLLRALVQEGRMEDARRELEALDEREKSSTLTQTAHFWFELYSGRPKEAAARLDTNTPLSNAWRSMALAQQGQLDAAFGFLEKALAGGYRDADELANSRWFAPLRADPRFAALLQKHGIRQ